VRYLEKAVFNLDYGQLKLVFEALHERRRLLENAPHLAHPLPIMTVRSTMNSASRLQAAALQVTASACWELLLQGCPAC
jgi:glycerol-3-phosphate dehydrogenase